MMHTVFATESCGHDRVSSRLNGSELGAPSVGLGVGRVLFVHTIFLIF